MLTMLSWHCLLVTSTPSGGTAPLPASPSHFFTEPYSSGHCRQTSAPSRLKYKREKNTETEKGCLAGDLRCSEGNKP
ncbi:hypothetical protein XENTR_v10009499 [Xenopus tropicalis]|nr:hypothetical protein XENTR_v10009499 [Xenopus tropicalis]